MTTDRESVVLQNNVGIKWALARGPGGYALGAIHVNGELLETPLTQGMFCLRHRKTREEHWLFASEVDTPDSTRAVLSGEGKVDAVTISFTVTLETPPDVHAVRLVYDISLDQDLEDYEICLQYHTDYTHRWKAHLYPWVEDSKWVERERLDNMGIPSVFLYREDRSLGILWGIDPNSDYLNPTTWTRDFGLYFIDGVQPAHFRVAGEKLRKDIDYHCPMQIVVTDQSDPDATIKSLMESWMRLNGYEVIPLHVRSNDEALQLFIDGRRESTEAWIPGKGYSLHGADHTFLYGCVSQIVSLRGQRH